MQVQIVFTAQGSNSLLGNFAPGDRMRCSAAHARHLVEEVRCARFADAAPVSIAAPIQTSAPVDRPTDRSACRKARARPRVGVADGSADNSPEAVAYARALEQPTP